VNLWECLAREHLENSGSPASNTYSETAREKAKARPEERVWSHGITIACACSGMVLPVRALALIILYDLLKNSMF
jgi:hypothetical protein